MKEMKGNNVSHYEARFVVNNVTALSQIDRKVLRFKLNELEEKDIDEITEEVEIILS